MNLEKTPNNGPNTVRAEIVAWLRAGLAKKKVKLPDLVNDATTHFLGDVDFLRRFASEMLRTTIYRVAVEEIAANRGPLDIRLAPASIPNVAPSIWARWENHLEHAGDSYVPLPELTPELGRLAIAERRARMDSEERAASFVERLIARLSPKQCVRECWTPEQVTALYKGIHGDEAAA